MARSPGGARAVATPGCDVAARCDVLRLLDRLESERLGAREPIDRTVRRPRSDVEFIDRERAADAATTRRPSTSARTPSRDAAAHRALASDAVSAAVRRRSAVRVPTFQSARRRTRRGRSWHAARCEIELP